MTYRERNSNNGAIYIRTVDSYIKRGLSDVYSNYSSLLRKEKEELVNLVKMLDILNNYLIPDLCDMVTDYISCLPYEILKNEYKIYVLSDSQYSIYLCMEALHCDKFTMVNGIPEREQVRFFPTKSEIILKRINDHNFVTKNL